MAVKIRLTRIGKKRQPSYRVVVTDARNPRDSAYIEQIGRYDPRQEPSVVEIDNERASYWIGQGAQPSSQVKKLLEISGALAARPVRQGRIHVVETPQEATPQEAPVAQAEVAEAPAEPVATDDAAEIADEPSGEPSDEATEEEA